MEKSPGSGRLAIQHLAFLMPIPVLNLFAGHRKLCAVSGLEGLDLSSERAQEVARAGVTQLKLARDSGHPLIRFVAAHLLEIRRCSGDG